MSIPITLTAREADRWGKRLIIALEGERELHRDKLDPDSAFYRGQFAEALWIKVYGSEPDNADSISVGNAILAAVAEAEANKPTSVVSAPSENDDGGKESVAEKLVRLALEHYRFGQTDKHEPFAVASGGANLAIMLRGGSDALRARLAKAYRANHRKTPTASALADAMMVLEGEALDAEAEPVALRLAEHEGSIVLDLGDAQGRAVIVGPDGWQVAERSPVLFCRTALTGIIPLPERGGSLDALRGQINVSDENWPLLVGWLVAALLPSIPHPVLLLSGEQGTGKSSAARVLVSLLDPSPAPLRSEPRDPEQWSVAAAGSWVVALDNLSGVSAWLSDALCKAATGDAFVRRRLYSDGALHVVAFRRVVVLTSIDAGAIRGDFGERLLLLDLERIGESNRQTEHDLDRRLAEARPRVLGALLDALAKVLAALPRVQPAKLPRMADFGRVLAACDSAGVTIGALATYLAQQQQITADVVDGDSFGAAIVELLRERGQWSGTVSELLAELLPAGQSKPPRDWPGRNGVRGRLKRLLPALTAQGIGIEFERESGTRDRRRLIRLTRNAGETLSETSELSGAGYFSDNSDNADNQNPAYHSDPNRLFADRAEVTL